jgi:hypothetical protein
VLHLSHGLNAQEIGDWAELEVAILNSPNGQSEVHEYLDDKVKKKRDRYIG